MPASSASERALRAAARVAADRRAQIGVGAAVAGAGAAVAARARLGSNNGDSSGPSRAYRLKPSEAPAGGIRRIALGRVDDALEQLRGYDDHPAEAIHEARKDLKKVRSLLRLVRDEVGEKTYRRENTRFRDAGRLLSAARNAEVKLQTIETLQESAELEGIEAYVSALEDERTPQEIGESGLREAVRAIEAGREAISSWPLPDASWKPGAGIERAYRRGRKALEGVEDDRSDEAIHDWRKRAKDLWYHLRILCDSWPEVLRPLADEAHELADHLGDHHDLSVLADDARDRDACFENSSDREALLKAIAKRQEELLKQAIPLGERLYAEKPKAFAARIDSYFATRP